MNSEIQHFINILAPYVHSYGYLVVFFSMMLENMGIPVPAETALIVFSFFASQGLLKIWLVIPIAIIGDSAGDNIGFLIGRVGGRRLIERLKIKKSKIEAVEALFRDRGGMTIFTAQFFSLSRTTIALIAGFSKIRYRKFLTYNISAATVFVFLVAGLTFYFGKNLDAILNFLHIFRFVALFILLLVISFYLYSFYKKKK